MGQVLTANALERERKGKGKQKNKTKTKHTNKKKNIQYLNQFVGMLTEHLSIFLNFFLIAILSSFNEDQEGNISLQERVGDMVHHSFAQL